MIYEPADIECPECDGTGDCWNNADPTSGQRVDCDACHGEGWRQPTQDEINDMAADAWSDLCQSEPPMSFNERAEMNARRDAAWGVK